MLSNLSLLNILKLKETLIKLNELEKVCVMLFCFTVYKTIKVYI